MVEVVHLVLPVLRALQDGESDLGARHSFIEQSAPVGQPDGVSVALEQVPVNLFHVDLGGAAGGGSGYRVGHRRGAAAAVEDGHGDLVGVDESAEMMAAGHGERSCAGNGGEVGSAVVPGNDGREVRSRGGLVGIAEGGQYAGEILVAGNVE